MLTSAFVSLVSCLDACLDAVGVRPPIVPEVLISISWTIFTYFLGFLKTSFQKLILFPSLDTGERILKGIFENPCLIHWTNNNIPSSEILSAIKSCIFYTG
jgi:hypothetical protein